MKSNPELSKIGISPIVILVCISLPCASKVSEVPCSKLTHLGNGQKGGNQCPTDSGVQLGFRGM